MAKATRGSDAQFTYDFGIAIAQSTVSKITRLTGVTLSLASAFYALKSTATEYVNTLRENTFRFGGILGTMKAMEQAQNRLIKGQSYFSVDDQLRGMNQLMAAGINVKKNLDWINKAAHASGQSLSQFSGAISNAIAGNMGQLVDMGLLTQRATRMFDKYAANTVMRQQAILNFVKNHKALLAAIRNDFYTIQDQMLRIKETWKAFLQSILGKPNDPSSFYGQIAQSMKLVADALSRNLENIKRVGWVIGQVLGWVMKQIGHFVVWIGKQMKQSLSAVWKMTDNYVEFTRSLIVWLEFWKLKIIDFFKEYGGAIKTVLKLVLAYKALKWAFLISDRALMSVISYKKEWMALTKFIHRYGMTTFEGLGRLLEFKILRKSKNRGILRLLGMDPKSVLGTFTHLGDLISRGLHKAVIPAFRGIGKAIMAPFWAMLHPIKVLKGALFGLRYALYKALAIIDWNSYKWLFGQIIKGVKILIPYVKALGIYLLNVGKNALNFLLNLPRLLTGVIKTFGKSLIWAFTHPIASLQKLWFACKALFTAIRLKLLSIYALNPFGWIAIAIVTIAILYKKFAIVRTVVNQMFKTWWEWIKLLWNLVYGAFIAIAVGCKRTWQFLNSYIFQPVAKFFKRALGWIKQMWNSFKDSSVGRFIDKWIVTPLKNLFEWIMKALRWVLKGAAAILSVINKSLAEEIRKGEKELGMDTSLAASGGDYSENDDTDYLDPKKWGLGGDKSEKIPDVPMSSNPISDVTASVSGAGGGGNTTNNSMNFSNGAIQIIVQKGEQIDENKLARLVRDTIKDVNREQNIRGGTI